MIKPMEKEKLESMLIDYIDGKLSEGDKQVVEQELVSNPEAYRLYEQFKEVIQVMDHTSLIEPSSHLKMSFNEMISTEIASEKQARSIFFKPAFYRVAASIALLIMGGMAGFWINQHLRQQDEIAKLKQDLEKTKALMMARLEDKQSPSQRILGVLTSNEISKVDDEIVEALINIMNEDPNSNVRLAAIEALRKFHQEPKVKKALISALSTQTDPLVQIALIQLMVEMKEKQAVKPLQKIIEDQEALPTVKDEAHAGIFKLS
jgi:hypothetical protein